MKVKNNIGIVIIGLEKNISLSFNLIIKYPTKKYPMYIEAIGKSIPQLRPKVGNKELKTKIHTTRNNNSLKCQLFKLLRIGNTRYIPNSIYRYHRCFQVQPFNILKMPPPHYFCINCMELKIKFHPRKYRSE